MGQYLCIGLRTTLAVERKNLILPFMKPEEALSELEARLVPPHLYDRGQNDDYVVYRLRDEAVRDEFVPFIKEFYRIRYDDIGESDMGSDFYIEQISQYNNLLDWIKLAEKKMMEGFQIDRHHKGISIRKHSYIDFHEECIILSLTGKVWMECYSSLFKFLINCIKYRISRFMLKDSLSIFITD